MADQRDTRGGVDDVSSMDDAHGTRCMFAAVNSRRRHVVMNEATRRRLRAWTRQLHQQKYVQALGTAVHAGTVRLCTEHTGAHPTLHSCSPC